MFAQLVSVEQDDFLADDAGMVDSVDELLLRFPPEAPLVLGVCNGMFVGHMFPQPGEEVKSVANVAENTTGHEGVVTKLLGWPHFARFF